MQTIKHTKKKNKNKNGGEGNQIIYGMEGEGGDNS